MQSAGIEKGLPFLGHGGMWGDLFIISPLLGVIVFWYGVTWSAEEIALAALIGLSVSALLHMWYMRSDTPGAHGHKNLSPAGWGHLLYMGFALAIFGLFYFFTPSVDPVFLYTTTGLIVFHLVLGSHLILGVIAPTWYPDKPFQNKATWVILGACTTILFGRLLI